MKKIILLCLLMGSAVFYSANRDNPELVPENTALTKLNKVSQVLPEIEETSSKKGAVITEALDKVKSTEFFEAAFSNLSGKEVTSRLVSTEKILNQSNLFQMANSESGLDSTAAKQLVELMRIRQALNKILLNRQLEEMHRKYL